MKKGPFKMKKAPLKDLFKKPVGPVANNKKRNRVVDNAAFSLSFGFEDPIKIQKVQREGITPHSQKFGKLASNNRKR